MQHQLALLQERHPQVVIATPGRLAELVLGMKKVHLGNVHSVVLDEIDNLLTDPFIGDVEAVLQRCPQMQPLEIEQNATAPVDIATARNRRINSLQFALKEQTRKMAAGQQAGTALPADSYDIFPETSLNLHDLTDRELDEVQKELGATADAGPRSVTPAETLRRIGFRKGTLLALVSATALRPDVKQFADKVCGVGVYTNYTLNNSALLPVNVHHALVSSPRDRAVDFLKRVLRAKPFVQRALIFVHEPRRVDFVCDQLLRMGFLAAGIHGTASKLDRKVVYLFNRALHIYFNIIEFIMYIGCHGKVPRRSCNYSGRY